MPATFWLGYKPNFRKLKEFGCIAHLELPPKLVDRKFDSRSKKCITVGYCVNGYRLWNPEDGCIILGRDVIFDESKFEFSDDWLPVSKIKNSITPKEGLESDEEFADVSDNDVSEFNENQTSTVEENSSYLRKSTRERIDPA